MAVNFDKVNSEAKGKWLAIFRSLGIEVREDGKHGTCPLCHKEKHMRVDDKDGTGSFICTCSSGPGIKLVKESLGIGYKEAFEVVAQVVGNCEKVTPREPPKITKEKLRSYFDAASKYNDGDLVDLYLKNRGITARPEVNVWTTPKCWCAETRQNERAMLGVVHTPDGRAVAIHRTYLDADGNKLDVESPKKLTSSLIGNLSGCAIRLFDAIDTVAITEGIETALAVNQEMGLPCWAAISAVMLKKWEPPKGIKNVHIVGDNDKTFTGQAAAYSLARRLTITNKLNVSVYVPVRIGDDFLDELIRIK